jgi:Tol biopolymer transport system component
MFYRASSLCSVALASALCLIPGLPGGGALAAGAERVPVDAVGQPIGNRSANPSLSYDGRFLAFESAEDGLTPDDSNGVADVYVFDYETGELVRASGDFLGAFGAGDSVHPSISADGRFVAFASDSSALNLPFDADQTVDVIDSNGARDIFVYDRQLDRTTAVSVRPDGRLLDGASDYPSISGDGRYVAFQSRGSTPSEPGGVWRIFVHDRQTGETRMVSVDPDGRGGGLDSERPVVSADGRFVAFETGSPLLHLDRNGRRDIYRYGMSGGRVELVSLSSTGEVGDAGSRGASISADGEMVAFESGAGNLVAGDTNLMPDVFVRDLRTGVTARVSVSSDGDQADGSSGRAAITADGSRVVFESYALSLASPGKPGKPGDAGQGNGRSMVFAHVMSSGRTEMVGEDLRPVAGETPTRDGDPTISGDGTTMVFNELPASERPGGLFGGAAYGELYRVGSCLNAPEFAVTAIMVNGNPFPIGGMDDNVAIAIRPGDVLFFRLDAHDALSCDAETMRIRLLVPQGGDVLPGGMTYIQDSDLCEGVGSAPIAAGVLANADDDMDDDVGVSFCWVPDVYDFLTNGGLYQLEFIADFPGALQPSRVTVFVQVQECQLEVDLQPEFDPGFTSGAVLGESQFDQNGDGIKDFLSNFPGDVGNPSNRYTENVDGDVDLIRLVPAEVATFDLFFTVDDMNIGDPVCPENSIELLDIVFPPTAPYQQSIPCTLGGASSPPLPCFISLDSVRGLSSPSGMVVTVAAPVFPLTKAQFEAAPGWPVGENLVSVRFTVTTTPTAPDIGNNLVSFRITDTTGHISDPQVNFVVTGCFSPPCCLIDQYQIEGVDSIVRDIPTEEIDFDGPGGEPPLMCAGDPLVQPAGDGIIDVFANQTLSFVVNGRVEVDCPGVVLTIDKDESGGDIFPTGVVCVDLDGAADEYVCLGESGAVDSDVMAFVEWTPTTGDISDDVYNLRFSVSDGAGRTSSCLVRVRVCPEPVCSGTIAVDGGAPMVLDFSDPQNPPTQTVTPGQVLSLHLCGEQDCGEFVVGTALDRAVYRTISIQPTGPTCQLLCGLGCMSASINCGVAPPVCLAEMMSDDPDLDSDNADGDNDDMTGAEDPYSACLDFTCTIPELDNQSTFDLYFEIIDASGKPQECCITLTVCPPVTCDVSDIEQNGGTPIFGVGDFAETVCLLPGDELCFTVTGGGGCDNETATDVVSIDGFRLVCLDADGVPLPGVDPIDLTNDPDCSFFTRNPIGGAFDVPVVSFPVICDDMNLCEVRVCCDFDAMDYGVWPKFRIEAIVTATAEDMSYMQTTTCGVMAKIEPCPPPTCVLSGFVPTEMTPPVGVDNDHFVTVFPGEKVSFDYFGDSNCPNTLLCWDASGVPANATLTPPMADCSAPPANYFAPQIMTAFNWTPGPCDIGDHKVVFTTFDKTGSMMTCSVLIRVKQCEPPVCDITSIMIDDVEVPTEEILGTPEKPLVSILPGQTLKYTIKGTLGCAHPDIDLDLECESLPTDATVMKGARMQDGAMTMRSWTIEWTPKITDGYCDEQVDFDCVLSAISIADPPCGTGAPDVSSGTAVCPLNVAVGECPPPTCEDFIVMLQPGGAGAFMPIMPETDGCYVVQPGAVVMFDVVGASNCPDGACNALTIIEKALPVGMMTPPLPITGGVDMPVTSTFTWTVTEADCGLDPTIVFNIAQECGESSEDCSVCFRVGDCDNPPTCELTEFMFVPNPEMCFLKNTEDDGEELCLDLPFEVTPDGYMISVLPGDKVKLLFCGKTDCGCTTLTLDADGLPGDVEVFCDLDGDGEYEPGAFPCEGDPFPMEGMPEIRQLCSRVEFIVPPTGSFHITFTVSDSDDDTDHAVCVLWVEVEDVCDDFEPNDECELPQLIDFALCGPYLSGQLEERCTPGCRPDTFLVLFDKLNQVLATNNNNPSPGNGKGSALYNITTANGLSPGDGSDVWLRIGVSGYPDGLGNEVFNGFGQNGPHGHLGEFRMTVTFFDGAGEIISPAVVKDAGGNSVIIDNPFVYTNEFLTGAEAFRVNFQGPRALQGGGTTVSASIEIDNTTGFISLCDDVDFFRFTGLVPMTDYCVAMVGGYSKECTPLDAQLGWYNKSCEQIALDCDSGPAGYPKLNVISDINGEFIVGVTGKGDDDFDGYLTPPPAPLIDDRAVNGCPDPVDDHGVCGCYTLCIMQFDPHSGALIDQRAHVQAISEAMHHGDMNMDGVTDTADLGMLMGRFGWSAEGATSVVDQRKPKTAAPGVGAKLSGAVED